MSQLMRNFGRGVLLSTLALSVGCGGGSGDSNGSIGGDTSAALVTNNAMGTTQNGNQFSVQVRAEHAGGTEISANALDSFGPSTLTGVWRQIFASTFSFSQSFGDFSIDTNSRLEGGLIYTMSFTDTTTIQDNCDEEGPFEFITTDLDLEDNDSDFCPDATTKYFDLGNAEFRIELYCAGVLENYFVLSRLSEVAEFNHGSITFSSSEHDDLAANQGVCGSSFTAQAIAKASGDVPDELAEAVGNSVLTTVTVRAPYKEGSLLITLTFPKADFSELLNGRTFNVVDQAINAGEVSVSISSEEFNAFPFVERLIGESGSVTITEVTLQSAQGSFDIITEGGDVITGSFEFSFN